MTKYITDVVSDIVFLNEHPPDCILDNESLFLRVELH